MSAGIDHFTGSRLFSRATTTVAADRSNRARVEALARTESRTLLSYFSHRVTRQADAADLLGETLLVLWRRANSLPDDETEGRMWMFGIARHVLTTYRRGRSRQIALADRLRGELLVIPATAGLAGETEHAPQDDRLELLLSSLASLSEADREIITLIHFDGFTLTEAGQLLHLRATTARSRYHRARNRLKTTVEAVIDGREAVAKRR